MFVNNELASELTSPPTPSELAVVESQQVGEKFANIIYVAVQLIYYWRAA